MMDQNNNQPKYTNTRPVNTSPSKGGTFLGIGVVLLLVGIGATSTTIYQGLAFLFGAIFMALLAIYKVIERFLWVYEQYKHVQFLKPPQE